MGTIQNFKECFNSDDTTHAPLVDLNILVEVYNRTCGARGFMKKFVLLASGQGQSVLGEGHLLFCNIYHSYCRYAHSPDVGSFSCFFVCSCARLPLLPQQRPSTRQLSGLHGSNRRPENGKK